jgi:hypothetical protein
MVEVPTLLLMPYCTAILAFGLFPHLEFIRLGKSPKGRNAELQMTVAE